MALGAGHEAWAAGQVPKAKSVIVLWLWGGPSHIDMFDPKPDAPSDFRGPFGTIPTRTPGMHFTEAQHAVNFLFAAALLHDRVHREV